MSAVAAGPLLMNFPASIVCGTEWDVVWKPFRVGAHRALEVGVFGISGLSGGSLVVSAVLGWSSREPVSRFALING